MTVLPAQGQNSWFHLGSTLGDKLQMVERAREDVYFRQLDYEVIARMREQNAQEAATEEAPPSLNPDPHREQAYEALHAFFPGRLTSHSVELRVVFGRPFERIVETAVAEQVGLIVMGTHGRTGLERIAVGSVAERVIRLAPCPILTLKAPTSESGNWLKDFYASFLQFRT